MYAVIETGGKQYKVAEGDRLEVERLAGGVEQARRRREAGDAALIVGGDVAAHLLQLWGREAA